MRIAAPPSHRRGSLPDPLVLIRLVTCVLVLVLVWIGCNLVGAERATRDAAQQGTRVIELRGRLAYLHEHLMMSARMAAASGDLRWIQRFDEAVPALEEAVETAASLATPPARQSLAETMIEGHRDLLQMERRALALAGAGSLAEARALLDGAEFGYLQDVYVSGMEIFGSDLAASADAWTDSVTMQTWLRTVSFGLVAILLVMSLMAARQRVRLQAANLTDLLTQLPNRRHFYTHLATTLHRRSPAYLGRHALVIIGIDRFKAVNDTYGHAVADRLLQKVTVRLCAAAPQAFHARVGGDEFAFLAECTQDAAPGDCPARPVLMALGEPYRLDDGQEISLGFSAGAVWIAKDSAAEDAMRHADAALRRAKTDGRGGLRVFDHAMDAQSRDHARLAADLRHAIDRGDIVPFFQPLVDIPSGRIVGVEALARWRHAERGWVSPAEFIPLAEGLGLIDALMERLLRKACEEALPWPAHVTVAFNVSPLQLRNDALPGQIRAILAQTGFPAHRLEVEVTESALVEDLDLARTLLEDLRRSGIRLALDDFGTGYSSLKHLRCLPFDKLKIDASFVGGMVDDPESGKIVAAVVGLGHSLGLSTVAEGVETPQVAALLRDLGCDIGQGWLYGRPVPAVDLDLGVQDGSLAA